MLRIGLTGGIGSGKSSIGRQFEGLGVTVIDADAISHQLTQPGGSAIAALRKAFGESILTADGALDRPAMREYVFRDPEARTRLEMILHPAIGSEIESALDRSRQASEPYAVLMIPLLIESGRWKARCDRVLVVDCLPSQQIERVMRRSGIPVDVVRRIMEAQVSREARLHAADDVIDNSLSQASANAAVARLHRLYIERSRPGGSQPKH